ncbi:hypothetical protein FO519_007250 [Halicephalobus sp. NKZ332]|nr:hypothetical protein FO519_007250 [Halicephalobus sp. NKZ332]
MPLMSEWMRFTTIHGMADLARSRNPMGKIFWSLTLLLFGLVTLGQVIDVSLKFVQNKWDSRVYEEYENLKIKIPKLTVCNTNRISLSKTLKYNLNEKNMEFLLGRMPTYLEKIPKVVDSGYLCKDWQSIEGIQIQMHFENKLDLGRWITLSSGRHYFISLKEKRSQVAYSNVSRTINKVFGESAVTAPCENNGTLKYLNQVYNKDMCLFECAYMNFIKYCKCLPFIDGKLEMCEADRIYQCQEAMKRKKIPEFDTECFKKCNDACNDTEIKWQLSSARFPVENQLDSEKFLDFLDLKRNFSSKIEKQKFIERNYLLVDVFFEGLTATVVESYESLTVMDMLNQSGGALSLWTGISIMTLIQAMIYFVSSVFEVFWLCVRSKFPPEINWKLRGDDRHRLRMEFRELALRLSKLQRVVFDNPRTDQTAVQNHPAENNQVP